MEDKPKSPTITVFGETHETNINEIAELISEPKTANQLRAEIIDKAKAFIEEQQVIRANEKVYIAPTNEGHWCIAEFIVNEEKRTVVALLRYKQGGIVARGIAKCNPSDVFNAYIGKAIALGRALGLDVSEFEQAVQPSEFVVGQRVQVIDKCYKETHVEGELVGVETQKILSFSEKDYKRFGYPLAECTSLSERYQASIINDSNAQYEVTHEES